MDSKERIAERLRQARRDAGFEYATHAAERFGWKQPTYSSHENGTRGFRQEIIERYARAFRVSPLWLMYGKAARQHEVPVVGFVGAGAEVYGFDDHEKGAGFEYVDPPPDAAPDTVALRVNGWSMYPALQPGDIVFYRAHEEDARKLIGQETIACLESGACFVKVLEHGSDPGLYTLASYNEPPIRDVRVTWCAPIEFVDKRARYKRV